MRLAQREDMIGTLATDPSDQPFGKTILPGRTWRDRLATNAHGSQSAYDDAAVDPVLIADQHPHIRAPTRPSDRPEARLGRFKRRICR